MMREDDLWRRKRGQTGVKRLYGLLGEGGIAGIWSGRQKIFVPIAYLEMIEKAIVSRYAIVKI